MDREPVAKRRRRIIKAIDLDRFTTVKAKKNVKYPWNAYIWQDVKKFKRRRREFCLRAYHRFILRTFIDKIMDDILYNNVQFDLYNGSRLYLSLLIADKDPTMYDYKFDLRMQGHDYAPHAITHKALWNRKKKYARFRLAPYRWWKMQRMAILEGKRWEKYDRYVLYDELTDGLQIHKSLGDTEPFKQYSQTETV